MGISHDDIRLMRSRVQALYDTLPPDCPFDLKFIREYIDVGEFQLAVDDLAYAYMSSYKVVPPNMLSTFDEIGTELGMKSGYPWPGIRKLLGLTGGPDEDT